MKLLVNESELDLIEDSFEIIKLRKTEFSSAFYSRLFADYPELKPLFSQTDIRRQGSKLYAALVLLVENLRRPGELETILMPLGKKHVAYGATAESYPLVGEALLATLEHFLGDAWTGEVADAWSEALERVTALMLRGAEGSARSVRNGVTKRSAC